MKNLVFLLIFSIPNVWAADYFVRPGISHSVIRNGNSYNTAWGRFSEIDWPSIVAGDSLHLCGKFSETLMLGGEEPKWGGAPGKNITISGVCNENAGSIQGVRNSAVVISRREYITVRDLLINNIAGDGIAAYGRGGHDTVEANRDLYIKNVTIMNVKGCGISVGCLNGYATYAPQTGILIEDVTIGNAGKHGIFASCNQSGTVIRRARVSGAATSGNYWGIDISSRFVVYAGHGWTHVTGPVYKIGMEKINLYWTGSPTWETIYQMIHTTVDPYFLAKNQNCTDDKSCGINLKPFEFGQVGSAVYINVGKNPKGDGIAFVSAPFGSATVEDSYVTTTSSNLGTTDGVGIGADLGTNRVTFRRNVSEKNDGPGFELSGAAEAKAYDNLSRQNGTGGFVASLSKGTGVAFFRNKSVNNGKWQYYAVDNPANTVSFTDNYTEGRADCMRLTNTSSVIQKGNTCINK